MGLMCLLSKQSRFSDQIGLGFEVVRKMKLDREIDPSIRFFGQSINVREFKPSFLFHQNHRASLILATVIRSWQQRSEFGRLASICLKTGIFDGTV